MTAAISEQFAAGVRSLSVGDFAVFVGFGLAANARASSGSSSTNALAYGSVSSRWAIDTPRNGPSLSSFKPRSPSARAVTPSQSI